jgi:uncharacterized protein (DUF58 family)
MYAPLESLRRLASAAVARWARQRQGPDQPPFTLLARRIYILPTRAGLGFAALTVAILATALNYGNSMAMLLAFLLAGFALIGVHECHRHLKGLRLVLANAEDSYAGSAGRIELRFENTLVTTRGVLQLQCESSAMARCLLPPLSVAVQQVEYQRARRGQHELGRVALRTTAPHGLFRAWCWMYLPLSTYVYPQPQGTLPLPGSGGQRLQKSLAAQVAGSEEWQALRPFATGDSPRAVAWKQYARGAPLLVAQYQGEAGEQHELSYQRLQGLDIEARLSQLCAWIVQCEQQREAYSLQLPEQFIAAGLGDEQRRKALRALAVYGTGGGRQSGAQS